MAVKTLEEQLYDDLSKEYGTCVTRKQVQRILNVTKPTAFKLITEGELESFKLGAHYRVPVRSIARYAAMGATPPKPKP